MVAAVITETATTKTFRLRRPDGANLPPFLAGQYVGVFADGTNRPYAISTTPARLDHWDLTVRRVPGGRVSNHLIDTLTPGDTLTTTGPMGTFHHNPLFHGDEVVFLAGGSGVVPAMSMIRDIVDNGLDRRFHLLHGSRTDDDIIFRDQLDALTADHPNIRVDHVVAEPGPGWTEATGFLTSSLITTLAGPLNARTVYVCGPQALYPYALQQFLDLGHPRRRIRFEANGAPTDPTRQTHWPADAASDDEVACRSGECSLCRVRVLKGTVHTAEEAKLRMSDASFGYTHSCVAYPITDVELDA